MRRRKKIIAIIAVFLAFCMTSQSVALAANCEIGPLFQRDLSATLAPNPLFSVAPEESPDEYGKYTFYDYNSDEYRTIDWKPLQTEYLLESIGDNVSNIYNLEGYATGLFSFASVSGKSVADCAKSLEGITENPLPTAAYKNVVPFVDWFHTGDENTRFSASYSDYSIWEWCAIFVCYCVVKSGFQEFGSGDLVPWTAGAGTMLNILVRERGYDAAPTNTLLNNPDNGAILPGDLIFYGLNKAPYATPVDYAHAEHVGIVVEVGENNSYIKTMEGNTNIDCSCGGCACRVGGRTITSTSDCAYYTCIVRIPYPSLTDDGAVTNPDGSQDILN